MQGVVREESRCGDQMLKVFQSIGLGVSLSPFLSHHSSPLLLSTFPTHAAAKLLLPLVLSHRPSSSTAATSLPSMSAVRSQSNPDVASTSSPISVVQKEANFCQSCGGPTKQIIPEGDEKLRAVCSLCGKVFYENPKMVVGCLVEHDNKILLCKRKIQPSYGLWTLPAGYLEIGESAIGGAARETLEEACAEVEVLSPFAQLDIPRIGQSYIIFRAKLKKPQFAPGAESLECALFNLDEIPFEALAFSSIFVTLKMYIEDVKMGRLKFHYCIINKRPGSSPSDTHGFVVDDHLQS